MVGYALDYDAVAAAPPRATRTLQILPARDEADHEVDVATPSIAEIRPGACNEAAMIAAAQRDPAAFGPLYERYVDQIYRYAYRRVGNHADAEDVTAQTFQQALAALPSYQWRGAPFGAWLYRIAGNLIIEWRRKAFRETTRDAASGHLANLEIDSDDPAAILDRDLASGELLEAIKHLSLLQQQILVLRFSHGLTNRQIGDRIGRTEGSVKALVHRSMRALRHLLQENQEATVRPSPRRAPLSARRR